VEFLLMRALENIRGQSFIGFCKDIKVSHSIFALPFAFSVFFLVRFPFPGVVRVFLLLVCMVTARSFSMGMNRYLDRDFDLKNPRTARRMIPSGQMESREMFFWTLLSGAVFIICAANLGNLTFALSVPLLLFLGSYSYLKRVTYLTHFYLGICLGLSPIAIEIALTGNISLPPVILAMGVASWTTGFDILYASQDVDFDAKNNLFSLPSRFGARNGYLVTCLMFFLSILCWCLLGIELGCGLIYFIGIALISAILIYEAWLVRGLFLKGLSPNLNQAFFTVNAWVSVIFFVFVVLDRWVGT
jgi:4-hydroxybenzoate polyprenyltransferase